MLRSGVLLFYMRTLALVGLFLLPALSHAQKHEAVISEHDRYGRWERPSGRKIQIVGRRQYEQILRVKMLWESAKG